MRHGFVVPFASERELVELARLGEARGWEAIFTWEAVYGQDAWVQLGAAAVVTSRIRLGTIVTPVPRYRPWDLASRVLSVDRLSQGRVVLGAGLGALHGNWLAFEEDEGRAVRAARLDENLEVYAGLLGGQPYAHDGRFWTVRPVTELMPPPPVQQPHPPVWVVGALRSGRSGQPSLDRAARWQGILPAIAGGGVGSTLTQDALGEIVEHVRGVRTDLGLPWEGYDVVVEGDSHGDFGEVHGPASHWEPAGATWWVESWWDVPAGEEGLAELFRRVELGPLR